MAYTEFKTLHDIENRLGVKHHRERLFQTVTEVKVISDWLKTTLQIAEELPIRSEKAKSEMIVMPMLVELRNNNKDFFTIHSGDSLNIDKVLKGECDFIISRDIGSFEINYPILQVVEAKKNDTESSIPQCAAQMIGAKTFNEQKNVDYRFIYGCVTTGDEWVFLKLTENLLTIDTKKYYLGNINEVLGVFQGIIETYK